jgi:hypothetical protein
MELLVEARWPKEQKTISICGIICDTLKQKERTNG